ncbi:hypothetical protein thalar_03673 [Litoreibacter arenae DSM 19593]|uniref:Uncharacterized protein n=1 Tax=Litoreibacter arenae DSM 19593 TaxID=1123360 RepID=S9QA98_9RHOB|nr:hypothetical protein thalar_03673 [Litoreibacter arenae DSM 19593]
MFQLPFAFADLREPVKLPTQQQGVFVEATFSQQHISCYQKGKITIVKNETDRSDELSISLGPHWFQKTLTTDCWSSEHELILG